MGNSSAKRKPKKKDDGIQIFGVSIATAAERIGVESTGTKYAGKVPSPVFICCSWVNKYSLKEEGLYRIPGDHGKITGQKAVWNLGQAVHFHPPPQDAASTVCSMLKLFLREVDGSLFSDKLHKEFIDSARKAEGGYKSDDAIRRVKSLLPKLPPTYSATLEVLFHHLHLVQCFHEINKMTAENLCTCIFPMTDCRDVALLLIKEFPKIFDQDMTKELQEIDGRDDSGGDSNQPYWKQLVAGDDK